MIHEKAATHPPQQSCKALKFKPISMEHFLGSPKQARKNSIVPRRIQCSTITFPFLASTTT
jgi:hypothetical protein